MILITTILLLIFLLNLVMYWVFFLRIEEKERKKTTKLFYKMFPVIWTLSLVPIPIINSSLLRVFFPNNYSYFDELWIFFALFGIAIITLGIIFAKRARRVYKVKPMDENRSNLITNGIFKLMRHPVYSAWGLIFLGSAIMSDSLISLIISLILIMVKIYTNMGYTLN